MIVLGNVSSLLKNGGRIAKKHIIEPTLMVSRSLWYRLSPFDDYAAMNRH